MTLSGVVMSVYTVKYGIVLIPLLVDDPLWEWEDIKFRIPAEKS